jgi:tRNA pseudouridine38-40 synthase
VLASEPAAEGFDARRDALSRTYCYRVLPRRVRGVFERSTSYWWPGAVDREALQACAGALLGQHDFTAFTPRETEHTWFRCRVGRAEWLAAGELLEFWIEADMFVRHMNRALVGTMLDVAQGLISVEQFVSLLEGAPRSQAGKTAPAHGLALASVGYADPGAPPPAQASA